MPDLSSVLWLSVLLQILAAILALRLIPVTGKTIAWILLSFGFMLMASRRAISLLHQQGSIESKWLTAMTAEVVALIISILILAGVLLLKNVFVKQRHDEDELRKLTQVVEENSSSTIITDLKGRIEYVNHHFTEVSGYELKEIKGKTSQFLKSDNTPREAFVSMWKDIRENKVWIGEFCNKCKSGELCWVKARVSPVKDANDITTHYVAVLEDITAQKAQRDALEYMAMHDALTDLPNRTLFYNRVFEAILRAEKHNSSVAVMLMDLNYFKVINDTLGHQVGDEILKKVAQRIKSGVKSSDTVARMGGDEFLIVMSDVDDSQAIKVAKELLQLVLEPIVIEGHKFDIGMSVGIAMYPRDGDEPDSLIQKSDVAMYAAKALISGYTMYNPDLDKYNVGRLDLLGEIRTALEHDQFSLQYQPRVNLDTMQVEGAEALVRWQHPRQGLVMPDRFIPLLEETGHITSLTRWIFKRALLQLKQWRQIKPAFKMSINISTRDLCDQELASVLADYLREYNLSSDSVTLEITESALMQYTQYTRHTLNELDDMGVQLAIDDFGIGYSSLSYLKELPVSELKIDKSFVINMVDNEDDEVIVRSTIDLGFNLGLKVVAEGVENMEACRILKSLSCQHAQGFYFSMPVNTEEMTLLLSKAEPFTMLCETCE